MVPPPLIAGLRAGSVGRGRPPPFPLDVVTVRGVEIQPANTLPIVVERKTPLAEEGVSRRKETTEPFVAAEDGREEIGVKS